MRLMLNKTDQGITAQLHPTWNPKCLLLLRKIFLPNNPCDVLLYIQWCKARLIRAQKDKKHQTNTHNLLTGLTNRRQVLDVLADTNEHLLTVMKAIHGIYPALPGLADFSSSTSSSVYMCVKYLHSVLYVKGVCVCRCVCISTEEESWEVVCFWS